MNLKDYVFKLKDKLILPHGTYASGKISDHDDGFHTNEMLKRDIHDAIKRVACDAKLFIKQEPMALVGDVWEYGWPRGCLKIHDIYHKYNNVYSKLMPISHDRFLEGFNDSTTGIIPTTWSSIEKKSEIHRFWDSTAEDYTTTSTVTAGDATYLYDEDANFGVTESGEHLEPNDIVWNIRDDSYGSINYLDHNAALTNYAAGDSLSATSGSNTSLVDSTADFIAGNVLPGHLVNNTTDSSWSIVTAVATTTLTLHNLVGGTANTFSNLDGYTIGIANEIYFNALNYFTTRGLRDGVNNTMTAGDTYQVQDKFETVPTFVLKPIPTSDDTTGTESLLVWFTSEPRAMSEDDDPSPIEDIWEKYVVDYAYIIALGRQPDRIGDIEGLEFAYEQKIAKMKRDQSVDQHGEAANVYNNISPSSNSGRTWNFATDY